MSANSPETTIGLYRWCTGGIGQVSLSLVSLFFVTTCHLGPSKVFDLWYHRNDFWCLLPCFSCFFFYLISIPDSNPLLSSVVHGRVPLTPDIIVIRYVHTAEHVRKIMARLLHAKYHWACHALNKVFLQNLGTQFLPYKPSYPAVNDSGAKIICIEFVVDMYKNIFWI